MCDGSVVVTIHLRNVFGSFYLLTTAHARVHVSLSLFPLPLACLCLLFTPRVAKSDWLVVSERQSLGDAAPFGASPQRSEH